MRYRRIILEALKVPIKKPVILFPSLMLFCVNLILVLIFLSITGLLPLVANSPSLLFEQDLGGLVTQVQEYSTDYLKGDLFNFLGVVIVFVASNFFIGAGILAMKYGLIKEAAQKRKPTIRKSFDYGAKFTFKVIELKIYVFVFTAILALILNALFPQLLSIAGSVLFITLTYFMIKLSYQIVNFILLFRYPILLIKDKRAPFTIRETFNFFRKRTKFVFATWIIIFLITTLISFVLLVLNTALTTNLVYGLLIFYLLKSFTDLVISLWQDIFLFYVYYFKVK